MCQIKDFNLKNHVSKMFHMFGGDPLSLEAVFSNELINVVIDRFGTDANIQAQDSDSFVLKTRAIMSEGLIQWLMRFGHRVKVIHPETLVNQMKVEATKFYENYHE
ncbi:WYL domain-containing protein [Sporosarcina jiandibaonis]|uniref:WYL domain-containing protein n=1 Tax=Sporosarcina jiandibaonis TaxID=2715535 RepID=UPI001552C5BB|nr:WYL domain-containing protein [Sporosarcina jiandibaonis]